MLEYHSPEGKTFIQRYGEALTQIPLYSREWTNFNPSDPAVTILETLCGYETIQQETIEAIPFEVKQNLMKMVGFEIRKGRTARLLLSAENVTHPYTLPANHKFQIGNLIFETNKAITIDDYHITGIYGEKNGEFNEFEFLLDRETKIPAEIFGLRPEAGNSLYFFLNKLPEPEKEMIFYFTLKERFNRNPFTEHMGNSFASIRFECYTQRGFVRMNVRDNTNAFLTSGEIRMRLPSSPAAVYTEGPEEGYCIRVVLTQADYDIRPKVTAIDAFLFEVWQKDTLAECHNFHNRVAEVELDSELAEEAYLDVFCKEEKGESYHRYEFSGGTPRQGRFVELSKEGFGKFKLLFDREKYGYAPAKTKNSVKVVAYTEDVMRQYQLGRVLGYDNQEIKLPYLHLINESFCIMARRILDNGDEVYDFVRPDKYEEEALTYHLLENDGKIVIEDAGDFIGAELYLAGVAVTKGPEGNIRGGNELVSIHDDSGAVYYNPGAGTGGAFREKIESVRQRFVVDMEMPYTAVTEQDYERVVKYTPGLCIHKARAFMDEGRNLVRISIKPGTDEDYPRLLDSYRTIIRRQLEMRRLLTTRVELVSPVYSQVDVAGTIYVKMHYEDSRSMIEKTIRQHIDYLNSEKNFGELLKFDEVFHAIELLDCVEYIYELSLRPKTAAHAKMQDADILPAENCLLIPGQVNLELITFEK